MALAPDQLEPRLHVDASRNRQHAVRPQGDLPVAPLAREAYAFFDQALADAKAARLRIHDEKPQLRDRLGLPHEEHRSDDLAVLLDDPAALAPGVEVSDEPRRDLRHQRLEAFIPAVLARVERAVKA